MRLKKHYVAHIFLPLVWVAFLVACSRQQSVEQPAFPSLKITEPVMIVSQSGDKVLETPRFAAREGDTFWILDDQARQVWQITDSGSVKNVFSGPGEGPGELGFNPSAIYLEDDRVNVIHREGRKVEWFSRDGKHLGNDLTSVEHGILYTIHGHYILGTPRPGMIEWQTPGGHTETLTLGPEEDRFIEQQYFVSHVDQYIFICTTLSHQNQVDFAVLDLARETVLHQDFFQTHLVLEKEDYPQLPEGVVLHPRTLSGLSYSAEKGFVLTELSLKDHESPRLGTFQAIHFINPATAERQTFRVYPGAFGTQTLYMHLKDQSWLSLDESNGRVIFFQIEQIGVIDNKE
jgi:hypothetical protein